MDTFQYLIKGNLILHGKSKVKRYVIRWNVSVPMDYGYGEFMDFVEPTKQALRHCPKS